MRHLILGLLLGCAAAAPAQSDSLGNQLNNRTDFQVHIGKATGRIAVDGVLDETDWAGAGVAKDFWMKYPDNKERARTKTEIRLTYDDHFLYIGATCFDSSARHIIPTLKRDVSYFDGDGIAVVLDPVNRMTNSYFFGVSPLGVQSEAGIQSFGDPVWSWDNKWFDAVHQYADRWTVEIAIPFTSLRYEAGKTTWGINFVRNDAKHGQTHTWARVPLQFMGYSLGYYGSLQWDAPPPVEKSNITLVPYGLAGAAQDYEEGSPRETVGRLGADAKVALSSQLNLDATVNPDFSQVDVDEQITNLTRFDIFYPEKRTFFLENSDVLAELGSPGSRPFFSRRIGLDDNAERVPIWFGARLSGNLNKTLRINAFDMQTGATAGQSASNYAAVAVQQALVGRSFFKLAVLNKQNTQAKKDYTRNLSGELSFTSKNNQWDGWLLAHHSIRPTRVGQQNFGEAGLWYHTDRWYLLTDYLDLGSNYATGMEFFSRLESHDDLLDTTYRVGYKQGTVELLYKHLPRRDNGLAQNSFVASSVVVWNPNGSLNDRTFTLKNTAELKNTARFVLSVSNEDNRLPIHVAFTDAAPLPPGRYTFSSFSAQYTSDIRKSLNFLASVTGGEFYNGNQLALIAGLNYRRTPWGVFGLRLERYDLSFPAPYNRSQLYLINGKTELSFTKNLIWTTFLQYNTQADNFNINSRLQWRYRPMSDLFIVYTDNYAAQPFLKKNRALLLKMSYWLNL